MSTFSATLEAAWAFVNKPLTLRCLRIIDAWSTTCAIYCLATSNCLFEISFLHEARIEIDEVARRSAHVGEMFDREAQAARPSGPS